jgi:hypothetical protein
MFENEYRTVWVNERESDKAKRKLNIEEVSGIFPQDKFDVTFYCFDDNKIPNFHIENNHIDMVFGIETGNFMSHATEPTDMTLVDYVLSNFKTWYDTNHKEHCMNTWFYINYEYKRYFDLHNKFEELPWQLTNMDHRMKWLNKRSIDKTKSKINVLDNFGPFPNDKFDCTVHCKENGTPRFHIENMDIDLVFDIENGTLLFRNDETVNEETENFVLGNVKNWHEQHKEQLQYTWEGTHCFTVFD